MAASPARPTVLRGIGVALACWALLAVLAWAGAFEVLDQKLHDWRYRLRGPVAASPRLALVEVDDRTIAAYGSWPLPRETYALLIGALEEGRARTIGFDLLFLGTNPDAPAADELLARMSEGRDNIVHAISFIPEDARLGGGDATPTRASAALVRHGRPLTRQPVAAAMRVALPYERLLESADALGHTAVAVDRDGVVRRVPQFVRYGDWIYPSLALRMVEMAARADSTLPQFELAEDGVWVHRRGGRVRMPSDRDGATTIAFAGGRASFAPVSMLEVLQWYRDGDSTALRRAFEGRLVLVGTTAVGEIAADVGATPFSEAEPLVFIHANAMNAAIRGWFLSRPPQAVVLLGLAVLAVLLGWAFSSFRLRVSALLALGAVVAVAALDYLLFTGAALDLTPTAGLLLPPVAWIALEGYRRSASERETRARERELDVARSIQRRLLPAGPPETPEFDVFGLNVPADAVGGDYYDWLPLEDGTLMVAVGDVSGHGVPAAILMSHLRASLHAETRAGAAPDAIVQAMHASLSRATEASRFATFFLVMASRTEPRLEFCNAGHNPPLLVRAGAVERLDATGLPLAMIEDSAYGREERRFESGDTLLLYSDGVTECPRGDEEYGDERLERKLVELAGRGLAAEGIVRALLADVTAFSPAGLSADDVTLVVIRRR